MITETTRTVANDPARSPEIAGGRRFGDRHELLINEIARTVAPVSPSAPDNNDRRSFGDRFVGVGVASLYGDSMTNSPHPGVKVAQVVW